MSTVLQSRWTHGPVAIVWQVGKPYMCCGQQVQCDETLPCVCLAMGKMLSSEQAK